jgi:hypothetical protein
MVIRSVYYMGKSKVDKPVRKITGSPNPGDSSMEA